MHVKFIFITYKKEKNIYLVVQPLRKKTSISLTGIKKKVMKDERLNIKFNDYLERFFYILTEEKEFEIIDSKKILNKCVIIEEKNIFYTSMSLNLLHHS